MRVSATNKITGEVVDMPADNLDQIMTAWQLAQQLEKMAKDLKDQLKPEVERFAEDGSSEEINSLRFKVISIQRYDYDKTVMRQVLDEDVFDLLLKPDKTAVDNYLKENLEQLGDISTELRKTMVEVGKPYKVIKLEKLKFDGDKK